MKVKELIKPTIIKKMNLVLFPLLTLIFILAGMLMYQFRSEQAIRLGKLQSRIASLNILEFVKSEMLNYINACIGYNNMVEMYSEVEPAQQREYLSELTKYVLQANPNAFSLRCSFYEYDGNSTQSDNKKIEVLIDNANDKVVEAIDKQFYKLGLLEHKLLTKTNNVTITTPYQVQSVDKNGKPYTYTMLSFYKAVIDKNNDIIGQTCFDVQDTKIKDLLMQLQNLSKQNNCDVHLYLNDDKKFINLSDEGNIDLSNQKTTISEDLMTIINDGYDAEYNDLSNSQYFFIIPARLPNFNSELTVVISFSHAEITKSVSDFAIRLFIIMAIAYILIIALLLYINKHLYSKFVEADIIIPQADYAIDQKAEGAL